jgi:hypothetical protein
VLASAPRISRRLRMGHPVAAPGVKFQLDSGVPGWEPDDRLPTALPTYPDSSGLGSLFALRRKRRSIRPATHQT